jgi:RHS repeat-associated protein
MRGGCTFNDARLVGDPVDVVTGACTDRNLDLKLDGPLPLLWRRYYDSSKNGVAGSLGWGHTHEFDRLLQYDADGLRYTMPMGVAIGFPPLEQVGDEVGLGGVTLRRTARETYLAVQFGVPSYEFVFANSHTPARPRRAFDRRGVLRFRHNDAGVLTEIEDSLERTIRVGADAQGRVTSLTVVGIEGRQDRRVMMCEYDGAGNLVRCQDLWGHTFSFAWDQANRMTRRTDRRGYAFHFEYDKVGRCVRSGGEDRVQEVRLRYLQPENVTIVTRADGGEWTYIHDGSSLMAVVDPYGGATTFAPGPRGNLQQIDPVGGVTTYLDGASGGALGAIEPFRRFTPAQAGREHPGPDEHPIPETAVHFELGSWLDSSKVSLPDERDPAVLGLASFWRSAVRTLQATPPLVPGAPAHPPHVQWLEHKKTYDETGVLIRHDAAGAEPRRWHRDPNGLIAKYVDSQGSEWRLERDSWNHLARFVDPLGNTTSYRYTSSEQVSAVIDPGGCVSEYAYDLKDRLLEVKRDGAARERYSYDAAANLVAKTAPDGRELFRQSVVPGGGVVERKLGAGAVQLMAYDDRGRLVAAKTDHGACAFKYDVGGRRVADLRDDKGVQHTYDSVGRVLNTTVLANFATRYTRAGASLIVQDPTGARHQWTNLGGGLILKRVSSGAEELLQCDAEGRWLLKSARREGASSTWTRGYRYSSEGDLLAADDSVRGTVTYAYDRAHRLSSRQRPGHEQDPFLRDGAGNLVLQPGLEGASIGAGNRMLSRVGETFEYDQRGRMTRRRNADSDTNYEYDDRDMLAVCRLPSGVRWSAAYDTLGRRIWANSGGSRTQFYWDADRLAAEIGPDGALRVYVYTDPFAVVPFMFVDYGSVDAEPTSGRRRFLFTDQIGVPLLVEDDQGSTLWSARADPYGALQVEPGAAIDVRLRFPGHYYDAETGLHYNRFRYYDPLLGRYIQPDPGGIAGGLNLYAYADNPLTLVDLRGLACGPRKTGNPREDGQEKELTRVNDLPVSDREAGAKPFGDIPPLEGKCANEIRDILHDAGFRQTQQERTQTVQVVNEDGSVSTRTVTDSKGGSEIWMRKNSDGSYEAVRMDQHGHERPPNMPADQDFAGEPPHVHREAIPDDQARRDGATVPFGNDKGQPMFPPGSSNQDVANSYNNKFTPGVYDTYGDDGNQTNPRDFPANHTSIQGS